MHNIRSVLGLERKTKKPVCRSLHELILEGFSMATAKKVQHRINLSVAELASGLAISTRTLHRFKENRRRLSACSSDRFCRLASIIAMAEKVLKSEEAARKWFVNPQLGHGVYKPLEFIETFHGYKEAKNLLGKMEHGVYSSANKKYLNWYSLFGRLLTKRRIEK